MKQDISALMDGEVSEQEMQQSLRDMRSDPEQRDCWEQYHIIGDALRNNLPPNLNRNFVNSVSQAIGKEELLAPQATVFKQKTSNTTKRRHPISNPFTGFAMAASVAMVAYVGVGMIAVDEQASGPGLASAPVPAQIAPLASRSMPQLDIQTVQGQQWNTTKPAIESRLNNYLYSHRNVAGPTVMGSAVVPYAHLVVSHPSDGE